MVNCRLITSSDYFSSFWEALREVRPSRIPLTADEIDAELLQDEDTRGLVEGLLKKAVSLKIDDVRTSGRVLSFHVEFDSISSDRFRGKLYPIPEHHEVRVRIPTDRDHRIGFVFGGAFAAAMSKARLNKVLARRGAFVDLEITPESLRRILDADATEIRGNGLRGVRTQYTSAFEGSRVDNGMRDYIQRARSEGGTDDWVLFVSSALGRQIRISVSRSTMSVSLPPDQEDALIDYVLSTILPAVRQT